MSHCHWQCVHHSFLLVGGVSFNAPNHWLCVLQDEISTGLDSSTTYLIVRCVKNYVHLLDSTVMMSLLQPAPEVFDLFDDVMLLRLVLLRLVCRGSSACLSLSGFFHCACHANGHDGQVYRCYETS